MKIQYTATVWLIEQRITSTKLQDTATAWDKE